MRSLIQGVYKRGAGVAAVVLASLGLAGCQQSRDIDLQWALTYEGRPIDCNLTAAGGVVVNEMRFYIHDVALQNAEGVWQPFMMDDTATQSDGVALLDFDGEAEQGVEGCGDSGEPLSLAASGHVPEGDYQAIRFTLGVPFVLNHQDPSRAESPLNDTSMHWHWLGGYKFLRASVWKGSSKRFLHLGSLACQGRIGAVTGCDRPNRSQIVLNGFDENKVLTMDVSQIVPVSVLEQGETVERCMGMADEAWCQAANRNLGLDEQGQPTQQQSVFTLESRS